MSAVVGKKREKRDQVKKTGFFEAKVIAVNPEREELEKILGTTLEKDPEYLGTDENGKTKLNLVFWVQDVKTKEVRSVRIFLKDADKVNQNKTKYQYINVGGASTWTDDETNIPAWFTARDYRKAKEGEEEMYNFVINWLNDLNLKDPEVRLHFDWGRLMRGSVKELKELIGCEFEKTMTLLATIKTSEKNGETVEYEQIYNRNFLPGWAMKEIRTRPIDEKFIETANTVDPNKRSKLQKFILAVTNKTYGIKDYYTLGELQEYDSSKNIAAGDKVISEEDTSY